MKSINTDCRHCKSTDTEVRAPYLDGFMVRCNLCGRLGLNFTDEQEKEMDKIKDLPNPFLARIPKDKAGR